MFFADGPITRWLDDPMQKVLRLNNLHRTFARRNPKDLSFVFDKGEGSGCKVFPDTPARGGLRLRAFPESSVALAGWNRIISN